MKSVLKAQSDCISIHAAREGGDYYSWRFLPDAGISIHAAREGGDRDSWLCTTIFRISIHAAREGGDGAYRRRKRGSGGYFNPRRP